MRDTDPQSLSLLARDKQTIEESERYRSSDAYIAAGCFIVQFLVGSQSLRGPWGCTALRLLCSKGWLVCLPVSGYACMSVCVCVHSCMHAYVHEYVLARVRAYTPARTRAMPCHAWHEASKAASLARSLKGCVPGTKPQRPRGNSAIRPWHAASKAASLARSFTSDDGHGPMLSLVSSAWQASPA